jgi:hypothetical protein
MTFKICRTFRRNPEQIFCLQITILFRSNPTNGNVMTVIMKAKRNVMIFFIVKFVFAFISIYLFINLFNTYSLIY